MNVLIAQERFHPNSYGMVIGLRRRGHRVKVLVHKAVQHDEGMPAEPIRVAYYRVFDRWLRGKVRDCYAVPRLKGIRKVLADQEPDVVLVKEAKVPAVVVGTMAWRSGARVVQFSNRVVRADGSPSVRDRVKSWLLPRCVFHTAGPGRIGEDVPIRGGLGLSRLLPYPVEGGGAARDRAAGERRTDRVRVLSVGSFLRPRKRMEWLVEAIAREGLEDLVSVTLIGAGNAGADGVQRVREAEARHGLAPCTIRCDLPYTDVQRAYDEHDLFVLPADREPFGAVVAEAMTHGLPVICSDTCGARVCLEEGVSGLVFASESVEDLGRKLRQLVHDREQLRDMGLAARARTEAVLSPDGWARAFEDLLIDRFGALPASERPHAEDGVRS